MEEMKQRPFLERVATDLIQRFGDGLGEVAIVFNNQRPIHYLKSYLAKLQQKVFWSPQFFTIQEFVRLSSDAKDANRIAQVFLLYEQYLKLKRAENPQFDESLDYFYPIGEIILDDFAQIDYELVDVNRLFYDMEVLARLDKEFDFLTEEQKAFLQQFWASFNTEIHNEMQARFLELWKLLPQLYVAFKNALREQNLQNVPGIYRALAENHPDVKPVVQAFQKVVFVGFNALNACEKRLFKKWQDEDKALFYFDGDAYYFEDFQQEAGHFLRQNLGNVGLKNALGEFPALLTARTSLDLNVFAVPGKIAQAKALAQLVNEGVSTEKQVGILLADESLLVPVLQSLPTALKDELNITMGYPFVESLTYGLLEQFFAVQQGFINSPKKASSIKFESVLALLNHPYFGVDLALRNDIVKEMTLHKLREVGCDWLTQCLNQTFANRFPICFQRYDSVSALMHGLEESLLSLQQQPEETTRFFAVENALIDQALLMIRQLAQGFAQHSQLSVGLAIRLCRRTLRKLSVPLSGNPKSRIQIMGLLESRNLNFDVMYLVGANEGHLPVLSHSASFIPYNLRRAYGLPVIENQQALSAYLFYRLLHSAEQASFIYNSIIDFSNSGELSRFVRQLQFESGLAVKERQVSLQSGNEIGGLSSEGIAIAKEGKVWENLLKFLRPDGNEKKRTLSATAFTTYLNSPLEFCYKYILDLKEPPAIKNEIEANRLGNVVHRIMQWLYEPFLKSGKPVQRQDFEKMRKELLHLAERAVLEEYYKGREGKTAADFNGQERLVCSICVEYCRTFLNHDEGLGQPISILELENDTVELLLDVDIEVQGKKEQVRLKGIIDRVDQVGDTVRIVDYKTGRDDVEVVIKKVNIQSEEGLEKAINYFEHDKMNKAFVQTLYYTYIYEKIRKRTVTPNLYAIRNMKEKGTLFTFKPASEVLKFEGVQLVEIKQVFEKFLKEKLTELFNPEIPFTHPAGVKVYKDSPFVPLLITSLLPEEDEGTE